MYYGEEVSGVDRAEMLFAECDSHQVLRRKPDGYMVDVWP